MKSTRQVGGHSNIYKLLITLFVETRSIRCLLSTEGFTWAMKCFRNCKNSAASIQPEPLAAPMEQSGAPRMKVGRYFSRGKINIVGINLPEAHIALHIVMRFPLSWEVSPLTCFMPFVATILRSFATVVIPVSSRFQMFAGSIPCFTNVSISSLKKAKHLHYHVPTEQCFPSDVNDSYVPNNRIGDKVTTSIPT